MRTCFERFVLLGVIFLGMGYAHAASLTPPHEPRNNSFYVCYERCHIQHSVRTLIATYRKFEYTGCTISRQPCRAICFKKSGCPPHPLKQFGWFNNYPQTLNAFYRCAYSA